ncbi:mevalonate kinase [Candidatus Gottesmanbacteria bacterium]|nr:mevalonate kinase [Candidatus Gottesmanbacteria bacterium]
MNKVTVSVPGKVHLMGEHEVVYGKPALLAAINLRLFATIQQFNNSTINKNDEKIIIESSESTDYVQHIIEVVKEHFKLKDLPPMKITITSQIPAGYHLGSSASVAVATVGALVYFLKKVWNPTLINQLAYEAEKEMHGNPSGGDNTTVTMGGFVWFRKELEFLKSIWQLPFKPPSSLNHFFLINTGRPAETTGEMVAYVKEKMSCGAGSRSARQKSKMEMLFNQNEEQTKRVAKALKEGDEKELLDAIRAGERTLEGMGVVSTKVIPLIRQIEKIGGAAKILGGGGRTEGVGFLLCYHRKPATIETLCKPYGYTLQAIQLGEEGARLEKS